MSQHDLYDVGEAVWVVEGSPPGCRVLPARVVSDAGTGTVCVRRDAGGGVDFVDRDNVHAHWAYAETQASRRNTQFGAAFVPLVAAGVDTDNQEGE